MAGAREHSRRAQHVYDYGLGRISDYPERLEELESYKECIRPAKNYYFEDLEAKQRKLKFIHVMKQ